MRKPRGATPPESPKGAFPILKAALYFQKPRCMKVTQGMKMMIISQLEPKLCGRKSRKLQLFSFLLCILLRGANCLFYEKM